MRTGLLGLSLPVAACFGLAFPGSVWASCETQTNPYEVSSTQPTTTSTYQNVGLYEWSEAKEAWVLLGAGYDPYFESKAKSASEVYVTQETLYAPVESGPGGGGGWTIPQRKKGNPSIACDDATTLPRVTATGSRPASMGILSVIWRGQLLSGTHGGGGAQGGTSTTALPAHPDEKNNPVTCDDEPMVRIDNAEKSAAVYGFTNGPRHRGRSITIRYSTGTTEKYTSSGTIGKWFLQPVPGTCKDQEN